jgi:dolichol-phosphate mannosyltransferase
MSLPAPHTLSSLDVIVPMFNEEDILEKFHHQLCLVLCQLPYDITIYYINDGSRDQTGKILAELSQCDPRIVVVDLSRNFGQQAALTAGFDLCKGDVVICMDGDGQHPPDLIPQMINLYQQGYDIVITQRIDEQLAARRRWTSAAFTWMLNRIGNTPVLPGAADYRLLSRVVVDALKGMREYHRFLRGMVAWMGYRSVILPYLPPERLGGKSKYSFRSLLKLGMEALFSFSLIPLQLGLLSGVLFFVLAFLEVVYVSSLWITGRAASSASGWSSLMFMLLIVGGTITLLLSFIGIYVGLIFQEVKRRPIYLIRTLHPAKTDHGPESSPPPPDPTPFSH